MRGGAFSPFRGVNVWVPRRVASGERIATSSRTSVTRNAMTWSLDGARAAGQFQSGEWFVLDAGAGVTFDGVTPGPAGGLNGSEVNPDPANNDQGVHSGAANYNAGRAVSYPVTLYAGDALVSTEALDDDDREVPGDAGTNYVCSWNNREVTSANGRLKHAEVVWVLDEAPLVGTYAPFFTGTERTLWRRQDVLDGLLLGIDASGYTAPPFDVTDYYVRGLQRPWLQWMNNSANPRHLHPLENMHSYHEYVGGFLSEVEAILNTTLGTEALLDAFIQQGIWQYGQRKQGSADTADFEFFVMMTGMLLGDATMANARNNGTIAHTGRAEDKIYIPTGAPSSSLTPGEIYTGWSPAVAFKKDPDDPYEEYAIAEMGTYTSGPRTDENYRHGVDTRPHMGSFMVSQLMGAFAAGYWPNLAPQRYLYRWMNEDWIGGFEAAFEAVHGSVAAASGMENGFLNDMWADQLGSWVLT